MAMYTDKPETEPHASVANRAKGMVSDISREVRHEVHRIQAVKQPVDPTQSDHVVRRHTAGLSISFFIVIALFLLAVIAGIAIYTRAHHEDAPKPAGQSIGLQRAS